MNKQMLILLPVLLLGITACNGGGSSSSSSTPKEHVHMYGDWTYVDEENHEHVCSTCTEEQDKHKVTAPHSWDEGEYIVAPTHYSDGEKVLKCQDCDGYKTVSAPKLTQHVFDQEVCTPIYFATPKSCTHGEGYYKSCICGEIGEEVFYIGEPLGHKATSLSIAHDADYKSYESGDLMDPSGLVLSMTCSRCNVTSVDITGVTFKYQTGNCFHVGDTKVTAMFAGASVDITGINVTQSNGYVTNFHNLHIGCHENISDTLDEISSPFGDVSLCIKDKDNNTVSPSNYNLLHGEGSPYTITASVSASSEAKAYSANKTIIVEHLHNNYVEAKGYSTCGCGDIGLQNAYYDLSIGGLDTDSLLGSQKGQVDLNTQIYDPNTLEKPTLIPGRENVVIVDLGVNKIKTKIFVTSKVLNEANIIDTLLVGSNDVAGYYVLGKDLDTIHTKDINYHNTKQHFNATVDGRGHSIEHLYVENVTCGLTGARYYSSYNSGDATFKNLNITIERGSNNLYGRLFGHATCGLVLDNFNVKVGDTFASLPTVTENPGETISGKGVSILNQAQDDKNVIRNCTFDLSGYNIYSGVVGHQQDWNGTKVMPHSFTNTKFINVFDTSKVVTYWTTVGDAPRKITDGVTYIQVA